MLIRAFAAKSTFFVVTSTITRLVIFGELHLLCNMLCDSSDMYCSGDEYTDAIPVPPPQQIHVTRSDADLHKAWRGRRPTRRDENPTEIPYSQTGSRSHHSIYPDQWSRQ